MFKGSVVFLVIRAGLFPIETPDLEDLGHVELGPPALQVQEAELLEAFLVG